MFLKLLFLLGNSTKTLEKWAFLWYNVLVLEDN